MRNDLPNPTGGDGDWDSLMALGLRTMGTALVVVLAVFAGGALIWGLFA